MKRSYLTVPRSFDFNDTFSLIKRSDNDPSNCLIDTIWYKLITLNNEKQTLLKIKHKNKLIIEHEITDLNQEKELKNTLIQLLGLDDTLPEHIQDLKLKQQEKKRISNYINVYLPSYTQLFEAIVQTVLGQQIAVSDANQARKAFLMTFGSSIKRDGLQHYAYPTIKQFLKHPSEKCLTKLSDIKLSRTKIKAIIESAQWLNTTTESKLRLLSNDQLQTELTKIHGIGQWTSDWLLLKYFRRFDLIPVGDLAIRKAFTWWRNESDLLSQTDLIKLADKYNPVSGLLAQRVLCAYQCHINAIKKSK